LVPKAAEPAALAVVAPHHALTRAARGTFEALEGEGRRGPPPHQRRRRHGVASEAYLFRPWGLGTHRRPLAAALWQCTAWHWPVRLASTAATAPACQQTAELRGPTFTGSMERGPRPPHGRGPSCRVRERGQQRSSQGLGSVRAESCGDLRGSDKPSRRTTASVGELDWWAANVCSNGCSSTASACLVLSESPPTATQVSKWGSKRRRRLCTGWPARQPSRSHRCGCRCRYGRTHWRSRRRASTGQKQFQGE